ncbi:VIT1/CCC1 transporter family protein [Paraburkholderia fungorum]|uniref:VIT1/CCC1 transporter family protein n=1 Tax=Paraburkholderia fungorum TaxID=134537 RepID=UPI003D65ABCC
MASAHTAHGSVVLAAVAGLAAGAISMATGEYVSVSSEAAAHEALWAKCFSIPLASRSIRRCIATLVRQAT